MCDKFFPANVFKLNDNNVSIPIQFGTEKQVPTAKEQNKKRMKDNINVFIIGMVENKLHLRIKTKT